MRTAAEIAQLNKWKQTALDSTKEKLPLWTMLGIAHTAFQRLEVYGDEESQAIAKKAQEDIRMVAVRYELKELLGMLEEKMAFEIDPRDVYKG